MNRHYTPWIALVAAVMLAGMVGRIALPAWLFTQEGRPAGDAFYLLNGISLAQGLTALAVYLGLAAWTTHLAAARKATPWRWCVFSLLAGPVAPALLLLGFRTGTQAPAPGAPAETGALGKAALLLSLVAAVGLVIGRPMAVALPELNASLRPYGVNQVHWLLIYLPVFAVHIGIGRWLKDLAIDDGRDRPTLWGLAGLCFGPVIAAIYLVATLVTRRPRTA